MPVTAAPYVLPPTTAIIAFAEGHRFHGVEIELRSRMTVGDMFTLAPLLEMSDTQSRSDQERALLLFGDELIVDWNLHEARPEGEPVKLLPNGKNFLAGVGLDLGLEIVGQWRQAMNEQVGVASPLGPTASAGLPSEPPTTPPPATPSASRKR